MTIHCLENTLAISRLRQVDIGLDYWGVKWDTKMGAKDPKHVFVSDADENVLLNVVVYTDTNKAMLSLPSNYARQQFLTLSKHQNNRV